MLAPGFLAQPARVVPTTGLRLCCSLFVQWRPPQPCPHGTATVRMLSQPRKKQPERCVDVFCSRCRTQLYRYRKGGKGSLVKCWEERIAVDYTTAKCVCPKCETKFAKEAMVRGRPAFKIIGDRVYSR